MRHSTPFNVKPLLLTPLLAALLFLVACGGTAPAEPVVVEKEVIKEVPKEVVVEKEITVTKEVVKEVAADVKVLPTVAAIVQAQPTAPPAEMMATEGIQGGRMPQLDYADVRQRTLMASSINNKNVAMLFSGLVEYNPETEDQTDLRCDLCTSWELAEDGVTYTFYLHPDAKFSDGNPVTAEDVAYSFLASTCPECIPIRDGETVSSTIQVKAYFDDSKIIDDHTIQIKTLNPTPAFLLALGSETWRILPKHVEDAGQLQTTVNMGDLVGSGPFIHTRQVKAVSNHYDRNPHYFKEGRPYLDGLDQYIITDTGAGIAAFKAEQVLMTNGADNFSDTEAQKLADEEPEKLVIHWGGLPSVQYIFFNIQKEPFKDVRVRQAVNLAMHRQPLNQTFTAGRGFPCASVFPPGAGYTYTLEECLELPGMRELNGEKHPDDLAEARRLLDEAGIPAEGFKILLSTRNCCSYPDISVVVMEQLKEFLGWDVDLKVWESSAGYNAYRDHDYTFAVQRGGANFFDPDAFLDRFKEGRLYFRWTGYVVPQIPELFERQSSELDVEQRRVILRELEEVIWNDPPASYLYYRVKHQLVNQRVQNFLLQEHMRKYEHIWCDPAC